MWSRHIVRGQGREAQRPATSFWTLQYVGVSWSNGRSSDAAWNHGQPFQFQSAPRVVISGWIQGQVGGHEGAAAGGLLVIQARPRLRPFRPGPIGRTSFCLFETLIFAENCVKLG